MTEYPFETTIDVRNADIGWSGHVNNSRFVDYLDVARDRYFAEVHDLEQGDFRHVIANLNLDFEREIRSLEPVTGAVGVASVGRTSTTLDYELRHGGTVVASATTVVVRIDDVGSPAPIDEDVRERLRAHEI